MFRHSKSIKSMFSSDKGAELYSRISETIKNEHMLPLVENGVLVGFSGGADSVFLLSFLNEFKIREKKNFQILAVHVNHCIRGDEADKDELFSEMFAKHLGVEFISHSIDVPALKDDLGIGLEEAARTARYSVFQDIIRGRNDIRTIAVAHNLSDNAETILMNILRGSGLGGLYGIKPVRDNIIRPIISVTKNEIRSLLDEFNIPYVIDSTNLESNYSRNYIRNEVMPLLNRICSNPEISFGRMISNIKDDINYLNSEADTIYNIIQYDEKILASRLREIHPAIFSRVIAKIIHENTNIYPEEKHIKALRELILSDNFIYSLHGDKNFVCERGICDFKDKKAPNKLSGQIFSLVQGENKISGTNLTVYVGEIDKSSLNVYNFSIQAEISSAIICDGLSLRFRNCGDSYRYSGMTHKLKKVYNDRNIPSSQREYIPIVLDKSGIVFVPGLSVRDGAKSTDSSENTTITFAYSSPKDDETEVYSALVHK